MVNWKTKYLEMKLKYINFKQKAGSNIYQPRQTDLMILDAYDIQREKDPQIYPEIESININSNDINDFLMNYGFQIEILEKPINYSIAFIGEVLHNTITDQFYLLKQVRLTGEELTPVELLLQLIDDYDYETNRAIVLNQQVIFTKDLLGLVFYPTKQNIVKAIISAQ